MCVKFYSKGFTRDYTEKNTKKDQTLLVGWGKQKCESLAN